MKLVLFSLSLILALAYLSSSIGNGRGPASIPVQNLAEIKVQKEKKPDFDRDLDALSRMESRYSEHGAPRPVSQQQAGRVSAAPAPKSKLQARVSQASRIRAQAPKKKQRHPAPSRLSRR